MTSLSLFPPLATAARLEQGRPSWGSGKSPHILVKRATVFWDYNNFSGEPAFALGGSDIALIPGYYTFDDLVKIMKTYGVTLQSYDHNNTVYVENKSQQELKLTRLATILGLDNPTVLADQGSTFWDKQMGINCGDITMD